MVIANISVSFVSPVIVFASSGLMVFLICFSLGLGLRMSKRYKVTHLSSVHPRYDTRIFVKICSSLANAGYDVSLIVADGRGEEIKNGVRILDVGEKGRGRLARITKTVKKLFLEARKQNSNIYHFHDPELIPLGILLKLLGHKVVYDVHEDVPRQVMSKHWIPAFLRAPVAWGVILFEWLAAKILDGIVAATPTIVVRFPYGKSILVQNFPIIAEFSVSCPLPYCERLNGFVYVGVIEDIRGAREMVRAMGWLQDLPAVKLEMAGVFSPAALGDELRSCSAWPLVNYHGHLGRDRVVSLLAGARAGLVVLHPTRNYPEAYPVKMFEYMAAGLPVIASDFPLWRKIIHDAECGLLVDPMNHKEIADAMRWIVEHPIEAELMGERGRAAIKKYNWENEEKKLLSFYGELAS